MCVEEAVVNRLGAPAPSNLASFMGSLCPATPANKRHSQTTVVGNFGESSL